MALDQSQTTKTNGFSIVTDGLYAQTFQAGLSGTLTKVTVSLQKGAGAAAPDQDLVCEIRTISATYPSATILATQTVAKEDIPESKTDIDFEFATPTDIEAGTSYAIVIHAASALQAGDSYTCYGDPSPAYANGSRIT